MEPNQASTFDGSTSLHSPAAAGHLHSPSITGRVLTVDPSGNLVLLQGAVLHNDTAQSALITTAVDVPNNDGCFFTAPADAMESLGSTAAFVIAQSVPPTRGCLCSLHIAVALIVLLVLNLFVLVFCTMLHVVIWQTRKLGASSGAPLSEL
jgi:hypothetical protein